MFGRRRSSTGSGVSGNQAQAMRRLSAGGMARRTTMRRMSNGSAGPVRRSSLGSQGSGPTARRFSNGGRPSRRNSLGSAGGSVEPQDRPDGPSLFELIKKRDWDAVGQRVRDYPFEIENTNKEGHFAIHALAGSKDAPFHIIRLIHDVYPEASWEETPIGHPLHCALRANASWEVIRFLIMSFPDATLSHSKNFDLPRDIAKKYPDGHPDKKEIVGALSKPPSYWVLMRKFYRPPQKKTSISFAQENGRPQVHPVLLKLSDLLYEAEEITQVGTVNMLLGEFQALEGLFTSAPDELLNAVEDIIYKASKTAHLAREEVQSEGLPKSCCLVCQVRPTEVMLTPCLHMSVCKKCSPEIENCPACGDVILGEYKLLYRNTSMKLQNAAEQG